MSLRTKPPSMISLYKTDQRSRCTPNNGSVIQSTQKESELSYMIAWGHLVHDGGTPPEDLGEGQEAAHTWGQIVCGDSHLVGTKETLYRVSATYVVHRKNEQGIPNPAYNGEIQLEGLWTLEQGKQGRWGPMKDVCENAFAQVSCEIAKKETQPC